MKQTYTSYGTKWTSVADKSFSWNYIELPTLKSYLQPLLKNGSTIIDAGCGHGRLFPFYLKHGIRETNIVGIDPNSKLLEEAKTKFPTAQFYNALFTKLLKIKPVDILIASYVLHLLDDKELAIALRNFHNWLKPKGHIFFLGNHPVRLVRDELPSYYDRRWQTFPTSWGEPLKQFHRTTADYLNAFIKAGFQIEQIAEPAPKVATRKINQKEYQDYTSTPCRLLIVARKI